MKKSTLVAALVFGVGMAGAETMAHGIVSKIVNSPLSAAGAVMSGRVGVNVYLQKPAAMGGAFMDPKVVGYGIPAGGRIEIELGGGYERDWNVALSQAAIMLVTGAPQQGLPGKTIGYTVKVGGNDNTFMITPTSSKGLPAASIVSPAPGLKLDPVRQRGIKVFHIGFRQSAFVNKGNSGTVSVRIFDGGGKIVGEGRGKIGFLKSSVPQILPTNCTDKRRDHNWQRVKSGDVLGQTAGTVPIALMMYAAAKGVSGDGLMTFKKGIAGAGVLSTPQLNAMGYKRPASIERYNGGLIVQDTNGDGKLDPNRDTIIGGVLAKAPKGARGQELKTGMKDGRLMLSQPSEQVVPKPGKRWGGAIMQLTFTAGSMKGKYRPTLALLREAGNLSSGDGSSYTYTIVVE